MCRQINDSYRLPDNLMKNKKDNNLIEGKLFEPPTEMTSNCVGLDGPSCNISLFKLLRITALINAATKNEKLDNYLLALVLKKKGTVT